MMNKINKNKRGQEEMIGFVVIIILLVVIGLVFLGFSMRQKPKEIQHQESQMLDTMQAMLTFSACGDNVRELIKECYYGGTCNDEDACLYAKELLQDMLDKTQGTDIANSFVRGYILNVTVLSEPPRTLFFLTKGNLSGNYYSGSIPIQASGQDIDFNLRFYYSEE